MLIAADNLSGARPTVRRALENRDGEFLAGLCRRAEAAGAAWLDLNPGYVPAARRAGVWRFLVETAEEACGLTLMLDAPQAATLETALSFCTRPPVLNMATAEEGRLIPVLDLAAAHDLSLVAASMTALVPVESDERLALSAHILDEAARRGITGERILIDPMIMPLALTGGERHARGVIETIRALKTLFDPAPRALIALSNLTTSTAGVGARFAAAPFLAAAWGAGLDVVMLDAFDPELIRLCRLLQVFGGERVFAAGEYGDG